VLGRAGVYHKQCLSCGECGTKLNVTNFSCGSDGDMYCRQCYAARWCCYQWTMLTYCTRFGVRGRAGSVTRRSQVTDIMTNEDDPNMCLREAFNKKNNKLKFSTPRHDMTFSWQVLPNKQVQKLDIDASMKYFS